MASGNIHRVIGQDTARPAEAADVDEDLASELYRRMMLARTLDEKLVSLARQGRAGTYAPLAGQEAAQVGAAVALRDADWALPTYRDHAIYLARGVPVRDVVLAIRTEGAYTDADPAVAGPADDSPVTRTLPPSIPVASHLPHAVGVGMASDHRGDDAVALASFGDGATSEGDFHEAMNFAGVTDAPVVFLCQNNQWAISVPFERQTATDTVAEKAAAYGFEGVRVDGTDAFAVHDAVSTALETARGGGGPTLVEAVTYRRGAHTTTDDPSQYRDPEDVPGWLQNDPVERVRDHLAAAHGWTDAELAAVSDDTEEAVREGVEAADSHPGVDREEPFEHVYAEPTDRLDRQR